MSDSPFHRRLVQPFKPFIDSHEPFVLCGTGRVFCALIIWMSWRIIARAASICAIEGLTMNSNQVSFSMNRALRVAVAAAIALAGTNASAADADSNLAVGASIANACSITTAPIAFGAYDSVLKAQINTTGSVTVTCTNGASTFVKLGQGLSAGTGSTDAVPVRRMASGANFLPYSLSTVVDQSVVWEMTTGVAHAGTGTATVLTVFGRIAAGENVPAGTYADTVVARVTF